MDAKLIHEIEMLCNGACNALSGRIRLMILYALSEQSLCVQELTEALDLPQSTISRNLKPLRECAMVRASQVQNRVYYELVDRRVIEALDLLRLVTRDRLQESLAHIGEPELKKPAQAPHEQPVIVS